MTKILRILLLFLLSFSYSFGDSCSVIDKNIKAGFSYATSKGEEILVTDFVHIPNEDFRSTGTALFKVKDEVLSIKSIDKSPEGIDYIVSNIKAFVISPTKYGYNNYYAYYDDDSPIMYAYKFNHSQTDNNCYAVFSYNADSYGYTNTYDYTYLGSYKRYSSVNAYTPDCSNAHQAGIYLEGLNKCLDTCYVGDRIGLEVDDKCVLCAGNVDVDTITGQCPNSHCYNINNKNDRFDCMCLNQNSGNAVSVSNIVLGQATDCTIKCSDGSSISTIGSAGNFFKLYSEMMSYQGTIHITNATNFCTYDGGDFIDVDICTENCGEEDTGNEDEDKEKEDSQKGENEGENPKTPDENQGEGGSDSGGGDTPSEPKTSYIKIKNVDTGEEETVEITHNSSDNSFSYRDGPTGNVVKIKPTDDDKKFEVEVTNTVTGETQKVQANKNESGKLIINNPETGEKQEIEIPSTAKPKEDDKDKPENPSDDKVEEGEKGDDKGEEGEKGEVEEGKGDNKDDKCEGEYCSFNGKDLGDPNDFDPNGELAGVIDGAMGDDLSSLSAFGKEMEEVKKMANDFTGSIEKLKESANSLLENPINSSKVNSCPINFNFSFGGNNKNQSVDLCKELSKVSNVTYTITFVLAALFAVAGFFKLLVILFASI